MARTRLFRIVKSVLEYHLADIRKTAGSVTPSSGISRRRLLQASAATALATAAPLAFAPAVWGDDKKKPFRIAIVGAGLAGLTTAYRLMKAGHTPIVYEGSSRLGGRVLTKQHFNSDEMYCELGAEFVDTGHKALMDLCKELDLPLLDLYANETGVDTYYFNGRFYTDDDIVGDSNNSASFLMLTQRLAEDTEGLRKSEGWTEKAQRFDQMSVKDYLAQFKGKIEDWILSMINVAYTGEFGLETSEQSSLNLLSTIGADTNNGFRLFGDNDGYWGISGGSGSLTQALADELEGKVTIATNTMLTRMGQENGMIKLRLEAQDGTRDEAFSHVICCIPFTMLRRVDGLSDLGLTPIKLKSINELGYGTSAKIVFGTKSRVWRKHHAVPVNSDGGFYSDLSFQATWESSIWQVGDQGILVNLLGGKAGEDDSPSRVAGSRSDLISMMPAMANAFDPDAVAQHFWVHDKFVRGGYSCPKVGQVTTLLDVAGTPELDGKLLFAGEHASMAYAGFMNGAVLSANHAAQLLLKNIGQL